MGISYHFLPQVLKNYTQSDLENFGTKQQFGYHYEELKGAMIGFEKTSSGK